MGAVVRVGWAGEGVEGVEDVGVTAAESVVSTGRAVVFAGGAVGPVLLRQGDYGGY